MAKPQIKVKKKNFEVQHVGTQNLKLEMLIPMQKSVFNFDHPSLRKWAICIKIQSFWPKRLNFGTYCPFSQARMIEIENGLLHQDQHLKFQVLSTHMPYFKEFIFSTLFGARPFKSALSPQVNDQKSLFWHLFQHQYIWEQQTLLWQ